MDATLETTEATENSTEQPQSLDTSSLPGEGEGEDTSRQGEDVGATDDTTDEQTVADLSLTTTEREELFRRQDRVLSAELTIESLKEDSKSAKEDLKAAQKSLRTYIIELREKDRARQGGEVEGEAAPATSQQTLTPTSWRDVPLSELSIPDYLVEKLAEHHLTTFGQLEDLRASVSLGRSNWPKGIGEAKITILVDAGMKFWVDHPEYLAAANGESVEQPPSPATTHPSPGGTKNESAAEVSETPTTPRERALELIALEVTDPTTHEWKPSLTSNTGYFESGQEAAGRHGWYIEDCPYSPGDECDDWLRGFLSVNGIGDEPEN